GDGFDFGDLRDYAERIKLDLLRVPNVAKIELIGRQDPKIYVEASNAKLAMLGVSFAELQRTLETQNAIAPAGSFETATDRIYLRTTGALDSVAAIRELSIRGSNGRLFRLGDIAEVKRDFVDPPQ